MMSDMAKKQQKPVQTVAEKQPDKPVVKRVPKWRQCPLCHGNYGGIGNITCTRGTVRYYKCNTCGFTWRVEVEVRSIEFQNPTMADE